MAALTGEKMVMAFYGGEVRHPVAASTTIYKGALIGFSSGYARGLVAADTFGGLAKENVDNSSGAAGDLEVEAEFPIIEAGVTGASATSVGALVYAASDNIDDLTLTATANTLVGVVLKWISGTTCLVKLVPAGTIQP